MQSSLQRDFATLHHTVETFMRVIIHILLSFPLACTMSWLVIEVIGSLTDHRIPAPLSTQLLAIAFALVFGYATALTFAVVSVVSGVTKLGRFLEQEIEGEASVLGKVAKVAKKQVLHI